VAGSTYVLGDTALVGEEPLEAALGIKAPWCVSEVALDTAAQTLTIRIDFAPGSRFAVPGKEGIHPVHDTVEKRYRYHHLNPGPSPNRVGHDEPSLTGRMDARRWSARGDWGQTVWRTPLRGTASSGVGTIRGGHLQSAPIPSCRQVFRVHPACQGRSRHAVVHRHPLDLV